MKERLQFYIDGKWVDPVTPKTLDVINPANEEAFARISLGSKADVDKAVAAARRAFERTGLGLGDMALVEVNEAFAAQYLAVERELGLDRSITNVNGGAIAIGHPIGASGARILVTLLHEMQRRNAHKGLATLCIGGGMGIALAVER